MACLSAHFLYISDAFGCGCGSSGDLAAAAAVMGMMAPSPLVAAKDEMLRGTVWASPLRPPGEPKALLAAALAQARMSDDGNPISRGQLPGAMLLARLPDGEAPPLAGLHDDGETMLAKPLPLVGEALPLARLHDDVETTLAKPLQLVGEALPLARLPADVEITLAKPPDGEAPPLARLPDGEATPLAMLPDAEALPRAKLPEVVKATPMASLPCGE